MSCTENKIIDYPKDIYICPICLDPHKSIDEKDPLSLEDAPLESLGGKSKTLTCTKKCNNKAGQTIDVHLLELVKQAIQRQLLPDSERSIKISENDINAIVNLKVDNDGTTKILINERKINPETLEKIKETFTEGKIISFQNLGKDISLDKLEAALLKTAYVLLFEATGYSIIMDSSYDIVREQIINPDKKVISGKFWLQPPYPKNMEGVYRVLDKGMESILVLFNAVYNKVDMMFGVYLPAGKNTMKKIIENIEKQLRERKGTENKVLPINKDRVNDWEYIKELRNWIGSIEN